MSGRIENCDSRSHAATARLVAAREASVSLERRRHVVHSRIGYTSTWDLLARDTVSVNPGEAPGCVRHANAAVTQLEEYRFCIPVVVGSSPSGSSGSGVQNGDERRPFQKMVVHCGRLGSQSGYRGIDAEWPVRLAYMGRGHAGSRPAGSSGPDALGAENWPVRGAYMRPLNVVMHRSRECVLYGTSMQDVDFRCWYTSGMSCNAYGRQQHKTVQLQCHKLLFADDARRPRKGSYGIGCKKQANTSWPASSGGAIMV